MTEFLATRIEKLSREIQALWDSAPNISDSDAQRLPYLQQSLSRLREALSEDDDG